MTTANATVHPFERAGLGHAPFRWVGVEIRRGPLQIGPSTFVGAPGQPMGCCAYCSTGIAECHQIRSADGKEFIVGCECVYKTGDARIADQAKQAARKLHREAQHARDEKRIAAAIEILASDPAVADRLAAMPHPNALRGEWFAAQTALDCVQWMLAHAGNAGKIRAARMVERAGKGGAA